PADKDGARHGADAPSAAASPAQAAAGRAAELWKLLGVDEAPMPAEATEAGEPAVSDLVARAWYDADPESLNGAGAPADRADEPEVGEPSASWTVDRLPTPAEGGVAAMFTAGAHTGPPPGPERARLSAMIEDLPDQPLPRVGPQDIQMDTPYVAPVAVWFWGDDDIYPGRGPSTARQQPTGQAPQPTRKRRRR
ncbi:MAG TPA: hypothetical protein VNY84_13975, partial [Acidimicrobiales bacterium]|nr:hypothetical protein [Acidimicrobiales bacterium]